MCRLLLPVLLFTSYLGFNQANENKQPTIEDIVLAKETFKYEVKYGFFKLGWIEVTLLPDTLYKGKWHKHLFTNIISNSRSPFIGTEIDHFHSLFYENENGIPVTSLYWKDNIDEGIFEDITYKFDRELGEVTYKEEDNTRNTLEIHEPATAGHLILIFSRLFAGSDKPSTLPIYNSKKLGFIHFENSSKLEKRKYKPFDGLINAYLTKGSTENISGPFGFNGNFRAWFLADDLRVPLEARIKVFLGNAIIKLIEYKKEET